MRLHQILFFLAPVLAVFSSAASDKCRFSFNKSRLHYETQARQKIANDSDIHPKFVNIAEERKLQRVWRKNVSNGESHHTLGKLLSVLLPKDVEAINHQLRQPGTPTSIKLGEPGGALMAKAHFKFYGRLFSTNVIFSTRALLDNLNNLVSKKKWLVGQDAKAAILFLHGGGTKSAGAHVAESMINHFRSLKVDVLSLDLPWHGEGPREFLGNFELDVKMLSAFAKKYVPPHVPLFVWGHSWGSVFAEKLMTMTDLKGFVFHKNLKGVMIFSTAVDAAPGKSYQEKYDAFFKRQLKAKTELKDQFAESEFRLWQEIVEDGKISPLGSFFSMNTILQLNQQIPSHKGQEWIPGLLVVGTRDPLVFVGYDDLYHKFYDPLVNIETHYLDKLPLYNRPHGPAEGVGHLVGDYVHIEGSRKELIHYKLSREFMEKHLNEKLEEVKEEPFSLYSLISIMQHYMNDFGFREFLKAHEFFIEKKTDIYRKFNEQRIAITENLVKLLAPYETPKKRVYHLLKQLLSINGSSHWEELKIEIKIINEHFAMQLRNDKLSAFLTKLSTVADQESMKNMGLEIQDILHRYFSDIGSSSIKKANVIIRKLLNNKNKTENNFEDASQVIKNQQLPKDMEQKVLDLLEQYYVITGVLNGVFVPSLNKILSTKALIAPEHREEVVETVNRLNAYVNRKLKLEEEIIELTKNISKFQKAYGQTVDEVKHKMRIIKAALQTAILQPPVSLESEYQKSRRDFEAMEKASDQMIHLLESESVSFIKLSKEEALKGKQQLSNLPAVEILFNQHSEAIKHFNKLYNDYVANRQILKKLLITAIEKGEMGSDFQEAVISVYGPASKGEKPKIGTQSLYLDLEQKVSALAELEAGIYEKRKERMEVTVQYQNLFETLLNKMNPDINVTDWWPEQAHRSSSFQRLSASDVFEILNIKASSAREYNGHLIKSLEDNIEFFNLVMHTWHKDLRSSLPPSLPTESAEN